MAKKKVVKDELTINTELLDAKNSYTQNYFYGPKGKWMAHGSTNNGKILNTLDTWKNEDGEYITLSRNKINTLFKEKKIWLSKR